MPQPRATEAQPEYEGSYGYWVDFTGNHWRRNGDRWVGLLPEDDENLERLYGPFRHLTIDELIERPN